MVSERSGSWRCAAQNDLAVITSLLAWADQDAGNVVERTEDGVREILEHGRGWVHVGPNGIDAVALSVPGVESVICAARGLKERAQRLAEALSWCDSDGGAGTCRGVTHAQLGVHDDNVSNAPEMYLRLGWQVVSSQTKWIWPPPLASSLG